MTEIKQPNFKTPENSSFEEFKKGCFLVPLTNDFKIDKWRGNGAKVNRKNFEDFLRKGVTEYSPGLTKKQTEKMVQETIKNFIESVSPKLSYLNPCVAVAYPLSSLWILTFLTEPFTPKKDGKTKPVIQEGTIATGMQLEDVAFEEMKELNFDPYLYTYTIMQRASEMDGIAEASQKSMEEIEKLKKLKEMANS